MSDMADQLRDAGPAETGKNKKATMAVKRITETFHIIGANRDGGYYAGRVVVDGNPYALIVAPKAEGEIDGSAWIDNHQHVPHAYSWNDGLANTNAMAAAGSKLSMWARDLRIAGHADWYIPSQDELEVIYRNLKPTTNENSHWDRHGINLAAIEPTRPYTRNAPAQTMAESFQHGADQAFEPEWYWSSTQHAADVTNAWRQDFLYGTQSYDYKSSEGRARAVRRLPINY
jgi:hypothetical protein